jgi:tetratricopeptide (TPR) repeat protein
VSLAPALGFFNYYPMRFSFVADHFQYLASIGPIVLAVAALARWRAGYARWAAAGCAVVAVAAFSILAGRQCHSYKDSETLWRDTVRKNATACVAWNNLAVCVEQRAEAESQPAPAAKLFGEAIGYCEKAIAVKPDYAEAYMTRGGIYYHLGQADLALRDYDRAIACRPDFAEAWSNRGILHADANRLDEALSDDDRAIALRPTSALAYSNRGNVHFKALRYADAVRDYSRAIALNELFAEAYRNRAIVWLQMKEYARGLADMRTYQKLGGRPDPKLLEALTQAAGPQE